MHYNGHFYHTKILQSMKDTTSEMTGEFYSMERLSDWRGSVIEDVG